MKIHSQRILGSVFILALFLTTFSCKEKKLENLINPCDTVQCQNNGICNNGACDCPPGYTGTLCETKIEPCDTVSCLNDGTCVDGSCNCPDGTFGDRCQFKSTNTANLQLRTEFGSTETLKVATDGIFAIWWSPNFDHANDLTTMFNYLNLVRSACLEKYGMSDPPNPKSGYFYNVYIHHGKDETVLPTTWGNGQGTDKFGMPYLALPVGAHLEFANISHEGFHVFQYDATSSGFAYAGDSQWYIETSAQWYMSQNVPNEVNTFIEAGAIYANPQLALWHSFSNEAPGDPKDWFFQVRQYGMHLLLYYLTERGSMDPKIITSGFYANTSLSPQEYIYTNFGGENFRKHFTDWSAHNTGGFDYISSAQYDRAITEMDLAGNPNNKKPYVHELTSGNVNGTFSPADNLKPRGWSYNVIKINNTTSGTYSFTINGDAKGSEGADAHFEGRIIVKHKIGTVRYIDINMADALSGSGTVTVSADETDVYLNVVSAPDHFSGNQTYNYKVTINKN